MKFKDFLKGYLEVVNITPNLYDLQDRVPSVIRLKPVDVTWPGNYQKDYNFVHAGDEVHAGSTCDYTKRMEGPYDGVVRNLFEAFQYDRSSNTFVPIVGSELIVRGDDVKAVEYDMDPEIVTDLIVNRSANRRLASNYLCGLMLAAFEEDESLTKEEVVDYVDSSFTTDTNLNMGIGEWTFQRGVREGLMDEDNGLYTLSSFLVSNDFHDKWKKDGGLDCLIHFGEIYLDRLNTP
jgi:hypothetical protein